MKFPDASRFTAKHDVVLVGYRGVDGSSRLDCPEVSSAMQHSRDLLSEQSYRAVATAYRSCANRLRSDGVDLAGYSIPEEVDDLEAARRALGYHQIDLVSESAGTRTAMIYAWRYPKSIHRSVMIGVNPPGNFLWNAKTTNEQIGRYAALCAQATSCRSRTPDLAASVKSSFAHVPSHWLFLPIKKGDFQTAAFFGLMNETSAGGGPIASPLTINTLLSADKGDASGAWFLSVMAQIAFPHAFAWGDLAAIGRSDATYAKHFYASGANHGSLIGAAGNNLIWDGGRVLNAWPANPDENEYTHVQNSNVPTLLIGGNLDGRNPARECDPRAPASPRERPSGRAHEPRPRRRLLALRTGSRQPSDQHLPRLRQGRHIPLHPQQGRLQPRPKPKRIRLGHPRRPARRRSTDGSLAALDDRSLA